MYKLKKDEIITFSYGEYEDYHKSDPYKAMKSFDLDTLIEEYIKECVHKDFINSFDPLKSLEENIHDFYPDFYLSSFTKWLKDHKYIEEIKSENVYLGDLRFSRESEYREKYLKELVEKEKGKE